MLVANYCKYETLASFHKILSINYQRICLRNSSSSTNENTKKISSVNQDIKINPNYLNRNPRNLEWSGHAHKRRGWNLHYPPKEFYHKCNIEFANRNTSAYVQHYSGTIVASVSTSQWYIKKHLFSAKDTASVIFLAKVLAKRCLNYGITNMYFLKDPTFEKSKKKVLFYETMINSGIVLEEPKYIDGKSEVPGLDYDNQNYYTKPLNLPFPPKVNKFKRKVLEIQSNDINKQL